MYDDMKFEKFVVEENLFRGLLIENLNRERKELEAERKKAGVKDWQIKVPFYEVENRERKEERIFTLEPKVNNGWILFNRALSHEFINQLEDFPNADHDDGPDVLEMLWGLVNNRYKPQPISVDVMGSR
jgi:predicted phage terminase large subunit-like protein